MHKTTHYLLPNNRFNFSTLRTPNSYFIFISTMISYVPPRSGDGSSNLVAPKKGEQEFDDVLSDFAQYGRVQFWDDRYMREQEPFEWYYDYAHFQHTIKDYISVDKKVMVAGCGNSNMPGDMVDDGYKNVICSDISRVVIDQLKFRYRGIEEISFFQGTMTDTDLPAGSINAILDKALCDTLLCTQTGPVTVKQYVVEVERLLDDNGVFIIISYGNPEQRLQYLEQYDVDEPHFTPWVVEVIAIAKPQEFEDQEYDLKDPDSLYFIYVCKKTPELIAKRREKFRRDQNKGKKKKK